MTNLDLARRAIEAAEDCCVENVEQVAIRWLHLKGHMNGKTCDEQRELESAVRDLLLEAEIAPYVGSYDPAEDCDCDKLPVFDMDGSYFDGVCKKCEQRMTEAGYDKLADGWIG